MFKDHKTTWDIVVCVRRQVACGTEADDPGTRGCRGGRGGSVGGEIGSATSGPEGGLGLSTAHRKASK